MPQRRVTPEHRPRVSSRRDAVDTQKRLLRAAGRLFALHGYDGANVRDICHDAESNLASVRHHFGSKEGLYRAVVVHSHKELLDAAPFPVYLEGQDPEVALGVAIEHFLRVVVVRKAGHPYAGQLLARELRSPTAALDDILESVMKPVRAEIKRIVGVLLGGADSERLRGHCCSFVIGLCVFHELAREALKRLSYPPPERDEDVPPLARLITDFALGGIRQTREENRG